METVNGGRWDDGMNFDGRPRRRHGQGRGVGTFCWERGVADHAWMGGSADGEHSVDGQESHTRTRHDKTMG